MTDLPSNDGPAVILTSHVRGPQWFEDWCAFASVDVLRLCQPEDVMPTALRSRPRLVVLDARGKSTWGAAVMSACTRLKRDSYSGVIPALVITSDNDFATAFSAGADEVIREGDSVSDARVRLSAMLRRSDRDIDVHPSTRLPGTREIAAELERRIADRDTFAVCYADLDHFKEFNDRYSYYRGNQVIQLLARVLHDIVKGLCGEQGFVGHIGGDDFLYVIPVAAMPRVCDEVIKVFDELMPLQYSEGDRRVGYFMGKDRRGQLHRVPLMTLSVGVVTNHRRRFQTASEVSELATEMKTYAKTLPGSVWVVDRRRNDDARAQTAKPSSAVLERVTMSAKTGGVR